MKMMNQQIIKENNLKAIYNLILNKGKISRAQIAVITNLTRATVSSLVDELIQMNLVVDLGASNNSAIGRNPNMLSVNSAQTFVGVVDWEKDGLTCATVAADGSIVSKKYTGRQGTWTAQEIAHKIRTEILEKMESTDRILGLSVVVPAMIDPVKQKIISTVLNLEEKNNILLELKEMFENIPMAFYNDTACLAYDEKMHSKIKERNFAYINIGEGVGATLFVNGEFLRGSNGMATQFGHFSIDRNGEHCECGNRGCLELTVGECGLAKTVKRLSETVFPNSMLADTPISEVRFQTIRHALDSGDPCAQAAVFSAAEDLAYGINNLISLFNPERVILGGNGVQLGDLFIKKVKEKVQESGFTRLVKNVKICCSKQDDNSLLRGATKIYLDKQMKFSLYDASDIFI